MNQIVLETMEILESIGLTNILVLDEETKDLIRELEDDVNLGVFECLNRDVCILATHDSSFRKPVDPQVLIEGKETIFPPVPFPELDGMFAVSSSPKKEVHDILVEKFGLELSDEATLLIGFDV